MSGEVCAAGGEGAALWIVTELSLSLSEPPPEGEPHPERNPVGPFLSRQAADEWASSYVSQFHSGSWSVAQLWSPPQTSGGEVAPGDETPVFEPSVQTPHRSPNYYVDAPSLRQYIDSLSPDAARSIPDGTP